MGVIVSHLDPKTTQPKMQSRTQTGTSTDNDPTSSLPKTPPSSSGVGSRPTHINLSSQPQIFGTLALSPSSSPSRENPFERPLLSPALTFYTAPSTPLTSPQLEAFPPNQPVSPPPEVVLFVPPPPAPPTETRASPPVPNSDIEPAHDEAFPNLDQVPVDPFIDDEGLSSLEKIYLYSRSQSTFHRYVSVRS
jgi:serine/threonine-protein phosphatase 4 regulatory subunit 1